VIAVATNRGDKIFLLR